MDWRKRWQYWQLNQMGAKSHTHWKNLKQLLKAKRYFTPPQTKTLPADKVGGNRLHLDRKVGEQYETALILEQVDILEIPTLQRYDDEPQGLNNDNHEYLLN